MERHKTREISIGKVVIGGNNPIAVQSMTNTKTSNVRATLAQIGRLVDAGCEIVRVGIPDIASAEAVKEIKKNSKIPVVADIHFDYKLAVKAIENGADKIRINPGNIGTEEKVLAVLNAAKKRGIPVRIGVNAGSLRVAASAKFHIPSENKTAAAMVASLMEHVALFEKHHFNNIVVSLKASDVPTTVEAYTIFSKLRDYPLHIGITEAGTINGGLIKSSAGIAVMLDRGLGDTVRVSLSAKPETEVHAAYRMLDIMGVRKHGVEIISCPTCARTIGINVIKTAEKVEKMTANVRKPVKIAVMGCVVNGLGEAGHADFGVTGSGKQGIIFRKGHIIKKMPKEKLMAEFQKELNKFLKETK